VTVMVHAGCFLERQYCAFTGTVRGQNNREFIARLVARGFARAISILEDFEQIVSVAIGDGPESPVVEHQDVDAAERPQDAARIATSPRPAVSHSRRMSSPSMMDLGSVHAQHFAVHPRW